MSVLVVHGGAGDLERESLAPELLRAGRRDLARALQAGARVLAGGGAALDAVVEAVAVLEDSALFNAGRGSVLRTDGAAVMDAAVMEGAAHRAGAVAAVRRVRNPVRAARAVLDEGRHVLLVGDGAETFAASRGLPLEPATYFVTERRLAQLEARRAGTVGAVARDLRGGLAAATSTGGAGGAHPARVGDSPIIGAGTWASDATCAVSATGPGELFMRTAFAHEVDAGMRLRALPLEQACAAALERVGALGGRGGCIAIDASGRIALPFTTPAMPRGLIRPEDPTPYLALHRDEPLAPADPWP